MSTVSAVNETSLNWEAFGNNVKRLRQATGMTQKDLADQIGRHQADVSTIENGKLQPTIETAYRIADALNIRLLKLLEPLEK